MKNSRLLAMGPVAVAELMPPVGFAAACAAEL
jgi:hypothetical protein